jgi:hypothetical protein
MVLFISLCYVLNLAAVGLFLATALRGWLAFGDVNHAMLGLLAVIVYFAAQTVTLFFFIGAGATVREEVQAGRADPELRRRSLALKGPLMGAMMLSLALVTGLAASGGAADTALMPGWMHGVVFLTVFAHMLRLLWREHLAMRESLHILFELDAQSPGTGA